MTTRASGRSSRILGALAWAAVLLIPGGPVAQGRAPESVRVPQPYVVPILPARVLDTRVQRYATSDGVRSGLVPAGATVRLDVLSAPGVPPGTTTVVVNLTATDATRAGQLTAFSCGSPQPLVSNVNFERGVPRAGSALVPVGDRGTLCVFTSAPTALTVDVNGYVPPELTFHVGPPRRILDTRGGERLAAGTAIRVRTPELFALVSVTATDSAGVGHLSAEAASSADPDGVILDPFPSDISTLNTRPGVSVTNTTFVSHGAVVVSTTVDTHVVVDFLGSTTAISAGSSRRLADTRWDGGAPIAAGSTFVFDPAAHAGLSGVGSLALNLTATDAAGVGHVTMHPADTAASVSSILNPTPRGPVSNLVVVDGVTPTWFETSVTTHLVIDLVAQLQTVPNLVKCPVLPSPPPEPVTCPTVDG